MARLSADHKLAVLVAAMTGLFGLLGVLAGGAITIWQQNKQEHATGQAAARLLTTELLTLQQSVLESGDDARWHQLDYSIDLSVDDRRTLASSLPSKHWKTVADLLALMPSLKSARRDGFYWPGAWDQPGRIPTSAGELSDDMRTVVLVASAVNKAVFGLSELAGTALEDFPFQELAIPDDWPVRVRNFAKATGLP